MDLLRRHAGKLLMLGSAVCLLISTTSTAFAGFDLQASTPKVYELKYEDNPGDTVRDSVIIKNSSPDPITLKMYASDGMLTRQGTFTVTSNTVKQRTVGLWTTMAQDTITVDGKSEKKVSFTINIPPKTTPGSYAGGIVASTVAKDISAMQGTGVTVVSRAVLPVYVTVPGEVVHKFDWQDFSHEVNAKGNHTFNLKFKNIGNTVIIFQTSVEIYGQPEGINAEELARAQTQETSVQYTKEDQQRLTNRILDNTMTSYDISLFSDQDIQIPLTWTKQPLFGQYTAKATTTYWELNLTSGVKSNPKSLTKEITFSVMPWWLIVLIIAIILLVASTILGKYFYRLYEKKHSEKYVVEENDTITSIADKKKVNWKKIAHLNKFHAPYELKKGQTVLIPLSQKTHEKK